MIVYLDTSSLVKLYVEEDGSSAIAALVKSAKVAATSMVAYPEARAAFARRFREMSFTSADHQRIKTCFNRDWRDYFIVNLAEDAILMAGNLAEKHALRGFDSIHLAAALILRQETSLSVTFSCFDDRLLSAAAAEGFLV
ncbi:MAG: PIN domain-containing protein [Desulfobacteraceae bacterium]|jgi:predicted nucleic acid-binding protein|nr:MAG: PIN domain-containing protein [Desulfobacteraceae bacterium]